MKVKVEVSNRHVHLSKKDSEILFGKKFNLSVKRELSQKGEFSSNSTLTLKSDKGIIENVRIVGPLREYTQVELSGSDAKKLGLNPPMRNSEDLKNSESIILVSSKKELFKENCTIIANRHMHINPKEAEKYHLIDNQQISATINGKEMKNIYVKIGINYTPAIHIDKDEASKFGVSLDDYAEVKIINENKIDKRFIKIMINVTILLLVIFIVMLYFIIKTYNMFNIL